MKNLIESIKYNDGTFPRSELQQIIEQKEEAIPYLLGIVREVRDDPDAFVQDKRRIDFLYALYLLSQFRERELFPLLIDILSLPGELPYEILDDTLTEGTGLMLASVFDGDLQAILQLVENTELDEYARGEGLRALVALVMQGLLKRDFVVAYLDKLLTEKLSGDYPFFNAVLVNSCVDLHPGETYESIRRAYEQDVVDTTLISLENVERTLALSRNEVLQDEHNIRQHRLIEDAIAEMEWWACFGNERKLPWAGTKTNRPVTVSEKIGRNEPCPCGSGKKYKKCCGK